MRIIGDRDDEYSVAPLDITYSWATQHPNGEVDYIVNMSVERGSEVGMHRMHIAGFDPSKHNFLALLKLTLDSLAPYHFEVSK